MDRTGTGLKLVFVGLLVMALLSAACNADKKKLDPPKFHIHKTAVDVGEMLEGVNITHAYKVRNNGVAELHIINVRPG
jgi:hypothetical protein